MRRMCIDKLRFWSIAVISVAGISGCDIHRTFRVQSQTVNLTSLDQIEHSKNACVKPILYTNVKGLEKLPVGKAKAKFIAAVLPSILVAKHRIEQYRKRLVRLKHKPCWEAADSAFYFGLKVRYKAKSLDDLVACMGTLPTSIVLAQAAVESGWGKSRFFLKASNLFGVWSFNAYESRIPARSTRGKKMIYLRSYEDMSQSINDYFEILACSRAYNALRDARHYTDDPFKLLPHLRNFSERRTAYTNQLKILILKNNLTHYDHYQIDPHYLISE